MKITGIQEYVNRLDEEKVVDFLRTCHVSEKNIQSLRIHFVQKLRGALGTYSSWRNKICILTPDLLSQHSYREQKKMLLKANRTLLHEIGHVTDRTKLFWHRTVFILICFIFCLTNWLLLRGSLWFWPIDILIPLFSVFVFNKTEKVRAEKIAELFENRHKFTDFLFREGE